MLNKFISLILIFILFSGACGDIPSSIENTTFEPQQDVQLVNLSNSDFPIACRYYDAGKKDFGQGMSTTPPYVWARPAYAPGLDPKFQDYPNLIAKGKLEDGFVVASEGVYAWSSNPLKKSSDSILITPAQLKQICEASIMKENANFKLLAIEAFKSILNTEGLPLVVGELGNKFSRIVIFGDSLSDNGNILKSTKGAPKPPYFFGRFSNGPVWNDRLALATGIAINNWAYAGAVTEPNLAREKISPIEILRRIRDQAIYLVTGSVKDYVEDFIKKELTGSKLKAINNTLFVVWAGGNDYMYKFEDPSDLTSFFDNPDSAQGINTLVGKSGKNIAAAIKRLYDIGARNFLVGNLPDIGIAPVIVREKTQYRRDDMSSSDTDKRNQLSKLSSTMARMHNLVLNEALKTVRTLPQINIIDFDAYQIFKDIFAGREMGTGIDFSHIRNLNEIKVGLDCFKGDYVSGPDPKKLCADPEKWLFWDFIHPNSKGHCIIAYHIHKLIFENGFIDNSLKPNLKDYLDNCSLRY